MKRILLCLLFVLSSVFANNLTHIRNTGILRVGVQPDLPPFSYDSNGSWAGYEIELARVLATHIFAGKQGRVEFVSLDSKGRVPAILENEVDIVISNLSVTKENVNQIDFSHPYYSTKISILTRKGENITDIKSIKDQKILTVKGSHCEWHLDHDGYEMEYCQNESECISKLKAGEGVAFGSDNMIIAPYATADSQIELNVTELCPLAYVTVGIAKNNGALLDVINEGLIKLYKEKFFQKLYESQVKPNYGDRIKKENFILDEVYSLF